MKKVCYTAGVFGWSLLLLLPYQPVLASPVRGRRQHPNHEPSQVEMESRTRMEIALEEEKHKEIQETCTELEQTVRTFTTRWAAATDPVTPGFSEDDQKQLKKIEKLARKIRSSQGAEGDDEILKNLPATFPEQIKLLSKSTAELKKQVEQSTRHGISVGIITRSQRVILLARMMAAGARKP